MKQFTILLCLLTVFLLKDLTACCYRLDSQIYPLGIKDNNLIAFSINTARYDSTCCNFNCYWKGTFSLVYVINEGFIEYKNILEFKDVPDSLYENLLQENYQKALSIVKNYSNFTLAELSYIEYFHDMDTCQIIPEYNLFEEEYDYENDTENNYSELYFTYNNSEYFIEENIEMLFWLDSWLCCIRIYKIKGFEIIILSTGLEFGKYGIQSYDIENCMVESNSGGMHSYVYNFVTWKGKGT
jgi:uncharacterized protein YqkB